MKARFVMGALMAAGIVMSVMVARAGGENSFTPGVIKSIGGDKQDFVMVRTMDDKSTKDIHVKVTATTTYSKDGADIKFVDLKVGQAVMCENQKVSSTERIAVSVKVTADVPKEQPAEKK